MPGIAMGIMARNWKAARPPWAKPLPLLHHVGAGEDHDGADHRNV